MEKIMLFPGITLMGFRDDRFKQGCLSIQFLRPMCREEASCNALLPTVLLRGTGKSPDLRHITLRLDDLYGASVGAQVRRIGDIQTTGLYAGFMEDPYAFGGDEILRPMAQFLLEMIRDPVLENGIFREDYVESEKANLISAIDSQLNNKRAYAMAQMLKIMCSGDSYGIPRLGQREHVEKITAQSLFDHYKRVLQESPVHIFYVGSRKVEQVAELLGPMVRGLAQNLQYHPEQTPFHGAEPSDREETMEIAQGKLCMGYVTPITNRHEEFPAMQVLNTILGAGMTSKLFMNIREKESLCYDIGSSYQGCKGLLLVSAGIDSDRKEQVMAGIAGQLQDCCRGNITEEELEAARQMLLTQLEAVHDSPGAMEHYYGTAALSGLGWTPEQYREKVLAVTAQQAAKAARTLREHTVYFLRGPVHD